LTVSEPVKTPRARGTLKACGGTTCRASSDAFRPVVTLAPELAAELAASKTATIVEATTGTFIVIEHSSAGNCR
jgi:hypothetical protein